MTRIGYAQINYYTNKQYGDLYLRLHNKYGFHRVFCQSNNFVDFCWFFLAVMVNKKP